MVPRRVSDTKAIVRILTQTFRASQLSVASLLGVAGFLYALKSGRFRNLNLLFSGTRQDDEDDDDDDDAMLVPGLQNLGNNCFLNVILQALASCKDFRSYLQWVLDDASETDEQFPLTLALSDLLQELCTVGRRQSVTSPRQVMLALAHYVRNFNLTCQQDAAEALLHLISSLQEEIVVCYRPTKTSNLSDIMFSRNLRMVAAPSEEGLNDLKRWHKHLRGPFDGILGSTLMCRTCSSQVILALLFLDNLSISPFNNLLLNFCRFRWSFSFFIRCLFLLCYIVVVPTLYVLLKVLGCTLENCLKKFLGAEKVENYFCHRCWHVAAVKYSSAMRAAETDIEKIKNCGGDDQCDCKASHHLQRMPWSNSYSFILKQLTIARFPKLLCIQVQRASLNMFGESVKLSGHIAFPLVLDLSLFSPSSIGSNIENNEVSEYLNQEASSRNHGGMYRLVTVVEHFGMTGSGHYTVYRSVRVASQEDEDCEESRWFSISDSEVGRVSESDVLGAEASLLFYEKL